MAIGNQNIKHAPFKQKQRAAAAISAASLRLVTVKVHVHGRLWHVTGR